VRRPSRHLPAVAIAAAAGLFAASPALAGPDRVHARGELVRYSHDVPPGATARLDATYTPAGDSIVTLRVRGLRPHTHYGAHPHAGSCGRTGEAAGPQFQHVPDPEQPSTDPAYANPVNEIWLDVLTDASGTGASRSRVPWQFSPDRRAGSVMIHAEPTHTGNADLGAGGSRLACLKVRF
jgi:Cu-Zn family superoxide dismutase